MEDTALEQYLILAKSAKGRAAVQLVQEAISNPNLYHFGELLDHENVQALDSSADFKGWIDLLRIFAYGTYADYRAQQDKLPKIDEPQALKLKQLTVVSLAAESKVIPYASLLSELDLKDTRALEDVIIEGMYAGLFKGKLDQKKQEFQVQETAGRDCKPGQIEDMIATLEAWCNASDNISSQLRDKITYADKAQEIEANRVKDFNQKVDEVKKNMMGGDPDGIPGAGHAESMEMDDVTCLSLAF